MPDSNFLALHIKLIKMICFVRLEFKLTSEFDFLMSRHPIQSNAIQSNPEPAKMSFTLKKNICDITTTTISTPSYIVKAAISPPPLAFQAHRLHPIFPRFQ